MSYAEHHWGPQAESLPDSSRRQVRHRRTPPPDQGDIQHHDPEGVDYRGRDYATPSEGSNDLSRHYNPWTAPAATVVQPSRLTGLGRRWPLSYQRSTYARQVRRFIARSDWLGRIIESRRDDTGTAQRFIAGVATPRLIMESRRDDRKWRRVALSRRVAVWRVAAYNQYRDSHGAARVFRVAKTACSHSRF